MSSTSKYPESGKLTAAQDERQTLADFIEWLGGQGIFLAYHVQPEGWQAQALVVHPDQPDQHIYRYLGIDTAALERERRQMLASLQEPTGAVTARR